MSTHAAWPCTESVHWPNGVVRCRRQGHQRYLLASILLCCAPLRARMHVSVSVADLVYLCVVLCSCTRSLMIVLELLGILLERWTSGGAINAVCARDHHLLLPTLAPCLVC